MKEYKTVRRKRGIKQRPSETLDLERAVAELTHAMPKHNDINRGLSTYHMLFSKLAVIVETVAESRHVETMEAYRIINSLISYYQV